MRNPLQKFSILCAVALLGAAVFSLSQAMAADDEWVFYESPSGTFKTHMLSEHTDRLNTFIIGDKAAVNSQEIASKPDKNIIDGSLQSYIVKFDQTIGPALNDTTISDIVRKEFKLYEDFYKNYKGIVNERTMDGTLGHFGGFLRISFEDPQKGPQTARIRILVSGSTKLTQIAVGPLDSLSSLRTRKYFNDFQFADGISVPKMKIRETWKSLQSPLGIFTIYTPPNVAAPYFPNPPGVKNSDKAEVISHVFKDPLREETLGYNVYGYIIETGINDMVAKSFVLKNHINKLKPLTNKIKFLPVKNGRSPTLTEVTFQIAGISPNASPRQVVIQFDFKNSKLIVQELIGSEALTGSPFAKTLLNLVDFSSPENAPTATSVTP
jgi:hypothetical protein